MTTESDFCASIDCCFPYTDRQRSLALAKQACAISANAAFNVVDEVSRPPKGVSAPVEIRREVLATVESALTHPLVDAIVPVARRLVDGETIPVPEALALLQIVSAYPGQFAALSVAYFACDDAEGLADEAFERIRASWERPTG